MAEAIDDTGTYGSLNVDEGPRMVIPLIQRVQGRNLPPARPVIRDRRRVLPVSPLVSFSRTAQEASEAFYSTYGGGLMPRNHVPWGGLQSAGATIATPSSASQEPDVSMLSLEHRGQERMEIQEHREIQERQELPECLEEEELREAQERRKAQERRAAHERQETHEQQEALEQHDPQEQGDAQEHQSQEHHQHQQLSLSHSQQLTFQAVVDANRHPENIQHGTFVPKSLPSKLLRTVPDGEKDDGYWERRQKNNLAARKSRETKRNHEREINVQVTSMERKNLFLRKEIEAIKKAHGLPIHQSVMTPEERRLCDIEINSLVMSTAAELGCREEDLVSDLPKTVKRQRVKKTTEKPKKTASFNVGASVQDSPGFNYVSKKTASASVQDSPGFNYVPKKTASASVQESPGFNCVSKTIASSDDSATVQESPGFSYVPKKTASASVQESPDFNYVPKRTASPDVGATVQESPVFNYGPSIYGPYIPPQSWRPVAMQPVYGSIPIPNYLPRAIPITSSGGSELPGSMVPLNYTLGMTGLTSAQYYSLYMQYVSQQQQKILQAARDYVRSYPGIAPAHLISRSEGRHDPRGMSTGSNSSDVVNMRHINPEVLSAINLFEGRHDPRGMSIGSSSDALNMRHGNVGVVSSNVTPSIADIRNYGNAVAMLPPPPVYNQLPGHFKIPLPVNPFRKINRQPAETAPSDGQDRFKSQEMESLIQGTQGLDMTVPKAQNGLREHEVYKDEPIQ